MQNDEVPIARPLSEASKDIFKVTLGFAALALLSRIYNPQEGQHVLRW
jgi:hypothetical protein